jgi:hypothetical protein
MNGAQDVFGHMQSVKILVILNPAGYMLDIFRFCVQLFEVYASTNFSKMISKSPEVSNFSRCLFLKLNRFICNLTPSLSRT